MSNQIYLDIQIFSEKGCFLVIERHEKPDETTELGILDRIEQVLREKLVCDTEKYALLPQGSMNRLLKETASDILNSHVQNYSRYTALQRNFNGMAEKEKTVRATVQRIYNLVEPPRIFGKLHGDLVLHTLSFLSNSDLAVVSQLNKDGTKQARQAKIQKARQYGYQGNNFNEAEEYLHSLSQSITTLVENQDIPAEFVVRKGDQNQIDPLATLKNIQSLNQESASVLKATLNGALKKYVESNSWNLIKAAVVLGADPNLHIERGMPLLHYAAKFKDLKMLELLLKHGANVNARQEKGFTPLCAILSISKNSEEEIAPIVKRLLAAGADITIAADNGCLPIHFAARSGYARILDLLITLGADVNARGWNGYTPLCFALQYRQGRSEEEIEPIVERLLAADADITIAADNGNLPIHFAAEARYARMLGLLIIRGADVNARGSKGYTPLCFALQYGRSEEEIAPTVERLLAAGANITIAADSGNLPIHFAAQARYARMLGLLIIHGADVNAGGWKGYTPLCFAIAILPIRPEGEIQETVETLLAAGANITIAADSGSSPIHFAVQSGNVGILDLLILREANINAAGRFGYTPLHWAVNSEADTSLELMAKLLQADANPNALAENGDSPLHLAAQLDYREAIEYLLLHEADKTLLNHSGKTPSELTRNPILQNILRPLT